MVDEVLHPGKVGIALRRHAKFPAHVIIGAMPVGIIERRVGQNELGLEVFVEIAPEGVGLLGTEVGLNAANGQIHYGQASGGGIALLAVNGNVADAPAMGFHKFLRLHEHATGTTAGIVNAALVRREHPDQETDDTIGRIELTAVLALGAGEHGEEVFVDPPQNVLRAIFFIAQTDGANDVDQLAEPGLVQTGAGIVLG